MTVKECYEITGSDYEGVFSRLMSEKLIFRFANKFFTTTDYKEMREALNEKNYEIAFRMAHNLKGMCANVGFTQLASIAGALCDELRHGEPKNDISDLINEFDEKYHKTEAVIVKMDEP